MKASLKNKLSGIAKVPTETVAESSSRISLAMKDAVRDFQKKQKASIEKASQIVLNA